MKRLTSQRCSGILTGYWSPAKKDELIQRLGKYEDTGLEPEEIRKPTSWISVNDRMPSSRMVDNQTIETELVYATDGERRYIGYFVIYRFDMSSDFLGVDADEFLSGMCPTEYDTYNKVTHWMPMPELPKEVPDHG